MNANEKVTTAAKLKNRVIKYPLFETTRVCVLQRIGRAAIKDEFFLLKISVSNHQFSTPYHRNDEYFDTIDFYRAYLSFFSLIDFRKKISTVFFSLYLFFMERRATNVHK